MIDVIHYFCSVAGACMLVLCACQSGPNGSNEEAMAHIRKLHETDRAASKAHDIETLRSLWTEDCVLLPPGQDPVVGDAALWAYMEEQLPEMKKVEILEYYHDFEEINIVGDWAYEWGTFHGSYRPISGGDVMHARSRLFRVLRRQPDGAWKVARAMWHDLPAGERE